VAPQHAQMTTSVNCIYRDARIAAR
jgi:hypothetical protein